MILNLHPSGSEPLKRGISSLMDVAGKDAIDRMGVGNPGGLRRNLRLLTSEVREVMLSAILDWKVC